MSLRMSRSQSPLVSFLKVLGFLCMCVNSCAHTCASRCEVGDSKLVTVAARAGTTLGQSARPGGWVRRGAGSTP